jgi:hypothetical protein
MTNLIERLHNLQDHYSVSGNLGPENRGIFGEAAARIEQLEAALREKDLLKHLSEKPLERMALDRIEQLEAALRKIAELEYLTDEAMQKIAEDALDQKDSA